MKQTIQLLSNNIRILPILSIGGLSHLLVNINNYELVNLASNIFLILSLVIPSIVYGIFVELIKNGSFKLIDICKRYIINYLLVSLIIYSPLIIFISIRGILIENNVVFITNVIGISIMVITIYVLPLALTTRKIMSSVFAGIIIFFSDFKNNLDLISFTVVAFIIITLSKGYIYVIIGNTSFFATFSGFTLYFVGQVLFLTIFITATLRLKDKIQV